MFDPKDKAEEEVFAIEAFRVDVQHRIQTVMNRQGVTSQVLADKLGVTESRIDQIFDSNTNISIRLLARVFYALDCECWLESRVRRPADEPRAPESDHNDMMRARAQKLLDTMSTARKHYTTMRLSKAAEQPFEQVGRDLRRLENAGLVVRIKESGVQARWKLADHLITCPCRKPYSEHHVTRVEQKFGWGGCATPKVKR